MPVDFFSVLNCRDNDSETPLHKAVSIGIDAIAKILIENGAEK